MSARRVPRKSPSRWIALPDSEERFSTGIADLDRLLGGGFARGSMALFRVDETIGPADRELMLTPTLLNFLFHSNGVMAVLPARESPHGFRNHLTKWVGRRRFDTRVRVIDYVGEDTEAPYVVSLTGVRKLRDAGSKHDRARSKELQKMVAAEKAVRGTRSKVFLEMVSFEIMDTIVGPEMAANMFLHGIKRSRIVGNLCLGIMRPGLGCTDAVRAMADAEFVLHRDDVGLTVRGIRPAFASHLVVPDPQRGEPYVSLIPSP
jgi:hypothetical protein